MSSVLCEISAAEIQRVDTTPPNCCTTSSSSLTICDQVCCSISSVVGHVRRTRPIPMAKSSLALQFTQPKNISTNLRSRMFPLPSSHFFFILVRLFLEFHMLQNTTAAAAIYSLMSRSWIKAPTDVGPYDLSSFCLLVRFLKCIAYFFDYMANQDFYRTF